ncbi:MAG: NAD(P)H-dependent oxidoreductase [Nitrospiraceae bacterium]
MVLGSPVYWSNMAGEVKAFIDDWQFKFGVFPEFKLKNRVGAAFATGGQISSGKELTMLSILAMLGNYMIVVSGGGAFGASATTEGTALALMRKNWLRPVSSGQRGGRGGLGCEKRLAGSATGRQVTIGNEQRRGQDAILFPKPSKWL